MLLGMKYDAGKKLGNSRQGASNGMIKKNYNHMNFFQNWQEINVPLLEVPS